MDNRRKQFRTFIHRYYNWQSSCKLNEQKHHHVSKTDKNNKIILNVVLVRFYLDILYNKGINVVGT